MEADSSLPPLRLGLLAGSLLSCKESGAARNSECAICMDDWDDTSHVIVHVQCGNGFHLACIDDWIKSSSRVLSEHLTCPICRGIFPLDNSEQGVAYRYWRSVVCMAESVHNWTHITYMRNWFILPSLYADWTASLSDAGTWEEFSQAMSDQVDRTYALSSVHAAIVDYQQEIGRLITRRIFYNRVRVLRLVAAYMLANAEKQIFLGTNLAQIKNEFGQRYAAFVGQLSATASLAPEDVVAHKFKNRNKIIQMRQMSVLSMPENPFESLIDVKATAFYQQMQAQIPQLLGEINDIMHFYLARFILNLPHTEMDADLRADLHHLVTEFENTPFVTKTYGRIALLSDMDRLTYESNPVTKAQTLV